MSTNGQSVSAFERAFADYVGAKYAIALANGTVTLEVALRALDVQPGDRVATTPLTMAATTIAILNVGAVPVYCDVDPDTWLMSIPFAGAGTILGCENVSASLPVSLYGLHHPLSFGVTELDVSRVIDDAAQTFREHAGAAFTSYSFQASKILALGEGGMLATNDEGLAQSAREISSLGYQMRADQARIDSSAIRSPSYARHYRYPCLNARMSDIVAERGRARLDPIGKAPQMSIAPAMVDVSLASRRGATDDYRDAIDGCDWITPQHVPDGWTHDYWTYAIACDTPERTLALQSSVVKHGGEMPYGAWRLTFDEPAFGYLDPGPDACPVARSLQPRLLQFQTNNLTSAEQNATALRKAIKEIG